MTLKMPNREHHIEFVLHNKVDGVETTPATIGFTQFNEFNRQVEVFLAGSRGPKLDQVQVSVGDGSYKITTILTALVLAVLEPDLQALKQRQDSLGQIDPKRAEIMKTWQTRSKRSPDLRYVIRPHGPTVAPIEISISTDYRDGVTVPWVKVEKYLFGTVVDMGGAQKVNVHLRLDDSGDIVPVVTDQGYLQNQEQNRLYHKALVRVEAEQNTRTGKLRHLRLLSFEDYEPRYDKAALDLLAEKSQEAWADVPDAAEWVRQLRGGA